MFGNDLDKAWSYRWLFLNFFRREISNRYVGSVTGLFWALIHPVALLAVYALVFEFVFNVRFPELGGHGFIAFVAVALWPWMAFQESVQRGIASIQNGAGLIKKVAFPHELLVHGAVGATFAVHLAGMALALLLLAAFGTLSLHPLALPLVTLLLFSLFLASTGLALFLAALQTMLRDVEHFLVPMFMIGFYITPILYPASMVPQSFRAIILLNPLSYLMERLRDALLYAEPGIHWQDGLCLIICVAVLLVGRWFFNRLSPHFEDFL